MPAGYRGVIDEITGDHRDAEPALGGPELDIAPGHQYAEQLIPFESPEQHHLSCYELDVGDSAGTDDDERGLGCVEFHRFHLLSVHTMFHLLSIAPDVCVR